MNRSFEELIALGRTSVPEDVAGVVRLYSRWLPGMLDRSTKNMGLVMRSLTQAGLDQSDS